MNLASLTRSFLGLALLAAPLSAGGGTTWYVDASAPAPGDGSAGAPYSTIQFAVDQASTVHGDTLLLAPGVYVENVDLRDKRVRVVGERGPLETHVLPASDSSPTFTGGGGWTCRLIGLTVRGNAGHSAVEIRWGEGIYVERCIVRDNLRGLDNIYDLWVESSTVTRNASGLGHFGGGHGADAITSVQNTIFHDNTETFYGFGLDCDAGLFCVDHSTFEDPLFYGANDFHLQAGSPCINTGDPGETDPDGSRRDVGALPYDPNYPLGETYCTPTANTSGGRAVIAVSGTASLSANDLVFSATRTPVDSSGLFFYGTDQDYFPLGDGFVCLGGAIGRLPLAPTGATGVPHYEMDNTADLPTHVPAILPGESRGFQYWFRDPFGGPAGWNYSNAVWVTFEP